MHTWRRRYVSSSRDDARVLAYVRPRHWRQVHVPRAGACSLLPAGVLSLALLVSSPAGAATLHVIIPEGVVLESGVPENWGKGASRLEHYPDDRDERLVVSRSLASAK